jgi:hypothetical protein
VSIVNHNLQTMIISQPTTSVLSRSVLHCYSSQSCGGTYFPVVFIRKTRRRFIKKNEGQRNETEVCINPFFSLVKFYGFDNFFLIFWCKILKNTTFKSQPTFTTVYPTLVLSLYYNGVEIIITTPTNSSKVATILCFRCPS